MCVRRFDEVGVYETKRSRISIGKILGNIRVVHSLGRMAEIKGIEISSIEKLEFLRTRKLGHHMSQNPREIGTVHQRGRVEEIGAIGKSLDKEVVHWCLDHQDIGDPGDKGFTHFEIANRKTPMRNMTAVI
jgi:hypothetical protein